jgi:hypothetical protein
LYDLARLRCSQQPLREQRAIKENEQRRTNHDRADQSDLDPPYALPLPNLLQRPRMRAHQINQQTRKRQESEHKENERGRPGPCVQQQRGKTRVNCQTCRHGEHKPRGSIRYPQEPYQRQPGRERQKAKCHRRTQGRLNIPEHEQRRP